jgi:hypothetical protein
LVTVAADCDNRQGGPIMNIEAKTPPENLSR